MPDTHPTTLPTNDLQPNPFQPRGKIIQEDVQELKQSIASYGILEPIVVAETPAGYQIVAGERRWRAARELGLAEVPVVIKKTTPRGMLEMALVENVQRVDLSAIERAQAFQQLMRDFGFSQADLANKIGKSAPYISNSLKLLSLPDAIKDGLAGEMITEGHARALLGIFDERAMIECYKIILKESASVRRAEDLVRQFKRKLDQQPAKQGKHNLIHDNRIEKWTNQLRKSFATKADVKMVRSQRQTKVTFVFSGSPEETQASLEKILQLTELK